VVDPNVLADKYSAEAVRYYLMNNIVTGQDADFDEFEMALAHNSTLAGIIGNLLNRSLNMIHQFRKGHIRSVLSDEIPKGVGSDELLTLSTVEA
jgi:methionyl-tRNA synthetase